MLKEGKFSDLFEAVNARDVDTMDRALTWLRLAFLERGQGTAIGYMYTSQLYRAGSSLPNLMGAAFKQAGFTMMQTTRWIILTEGFQCGDDTAPANRLGLLDSGFASLDREVKGLEAIHRREILSSAFMQLKVHFLHRVDDEWLCNGGNEYSAAYEKKHGAAPAVNAAYDPEIRPRILPASQWSTKRERAIEGIVRSARDEAQVDLR